MPSRYLLNDLINCVHCFYSLEQVFIVYALCEWCYGEEERDKISFLSQLVFNMMGMGCVHNHHPHPNNSQLILSACNMPGTLLSVYRLYLIESSQ